MSIATFALGGHHRAARGRGDRGNRGEPVTARLGRLAIRATRRGARDWLAADGPCTRVNCRYPRSSTACAAAGIGRGEVAGFEASVVLNRKDFGVGDDLPLEGGGSMVGDKVTITLAIEALKQA